MASIANDPGGRRRILFVAPDGARKTIRLGKIDRRSAEGVARYVEALLASRISGQPVPRETAVWLAGVGTPLRERLARAGLIEPETKPSVRVLLERFFARGDVKESTKAVRRTWAARLIEAFGDRPIGSITPADAEGFRDLLLRAGLAGATVGRMLRFARQVFTLAVREGVITRNPFDCLAYNFKEGQGKPRDYAEVGDVERLLEVCPPAWRVLVALARFAGLRCPSEALLLKWEHVDLPGRRLIVVSPKTENQGKAWRVVPLTPELYPYLEAAWQASEGLEYVVDLPQYRSKTTNWVACNIRTQLSRLMKRAGVPAWRRPFRTFRSSCVTDWARRFPIHAVASWAGHTVPVAGKHYLTVTDADFCAAIGLEATAAQKAAQ